jgi:hypothetical protein
MTTDSDAIELTSLADFIDQIGFGVELRGVTPERRERIRAAAMPLLARNFEGSKTEIRNLRSQAEIDVVAIALAMRTRSLLKYHGPLLELSRSGATPALGGVLSQVVDEARALLDANSQQAESELQNSVETQIRASLTAVEQWLPPASAVSIEEQVKRRVTEQRIAEARAATASQRHLPTTAKQSNSDAGQTSPPKSLALALILLVALGAFLASSWHSLYGSPDPERQEFIANLRQDLPALQDALSADRSLILIVEPDWLSKPALTQREEVTRLLERAPGDHNEVMGTDTSGRLLLA